MRAMAMSLIGLWLCVATPAFAAPEAAAAVTIASPALRIDYDTAMRSRVTSLLGGAPTALTDYRESEYVEDAKGKPLADFALVSHRTEPVKDESGAGTRTLIIGQSPEGLEKQISITLHDRYPGLAAIRVTYVNRGAADLILSRWVNSDYRLKPEGAAAPAFWSYQGASYPDRRDWLAPLSAGFSQQNDMGMNASDYGGGTPIIDLWRVHGGLAIGHLERSPKLVSLPVKVGADGADMHIEMDVASRLGPGQSLSTIETFVGVHQRDAYAVLKAYRQLMADRGLKAAVPPAGAYESIWCAWGYERDFTVDQVLATLPKVKSLGLKWVVFDDGWQTALGDWKPNPKKFPRGDADMRAFTEAVKKAGMKPALWISPLSVEPGSDLLHDHPDMLLRDKDGAPQAISYWNSFYLCPAYPKTVEDMKALVRRALNDWGFEGLKVDGQHLNGVAACYNPAHHHASPNDSVEQLQDFYKAMYDTATAIKPDAVIELCPCGTAYAFHNTPFMNQSVASDPESSWQIRLKGKVLRGLTGDSAAFSGDHVELSDNGDDFASTVGIGAVLATKFTWPTDNHPQEKLILTPQREPVWRHWINIYNTKMLSTGTYRGDLYDIGFDKPETHAIEKNGRLYYAFYAKAWNGPVELRGLSARRYRLTDYVNGRDLGVVSGPTAMLPAAFQGSLLLEAAPVP